MSNDKLLFIHGWATDSWTWKAAAAQIGLPAVQMTLPGHGPSASWDAPTLAPGLTECGRLLQNVAQGFSPENPAHGLVIGVGWSLGGQILLASAMKDPSRFKALILVGATPRFVASRDFPDGQSPALVRRMIKDIHKDAASTLNRFYKLNFTDDEITDGPASDFLRRYERVGSMERNEITPDRFPAFRYADIFTALEAIYSADLRDGLSGIRLPTLIIHGASDAVTPVGASRFLAEHIQGSQLVVFDKTGHAPHITHTDEFARTVKAFLERL